MKAKRSVVGLIAAAAVLAAVPSATVAAKAHPAAKSHHGKAHPAVGKGAKARASHTLLLGSLTSISATSVTVAGSSGSTTVAVTANTRYIAHTQAAAIAGLKAGNQVIVVVVTKKTGPTAASISYGTVPFGIGVRIAGTVAAGTATSLTIKTAGNQSVTVTINGNTKVVVNGAPVASGSAIPLNQPVVVQADMMTDGSIVARNIVVGPTPARPLHVVFRGTITGTTATSLTIAPANNGAAIIVQLNAQTKYFVAGKPVAAAPSFTTNQPVVVVAIKQADGSLVATRVDLPAK